MSGAHCGKILHLRFIDTTLRREPRAAASCAVFVMP